MGLFRLNFDSNNAWIFTQACVIDGRGHLMGRLASVVAKNILNGNKVVVVRCEGINQSGNFYRNKLKVLKFLRLRCNVKPSRGPFHFRAPSKMFWRVVRGMVPHKTERGKDAMKRLQTSRVSHPHTIRRRGWSSPPPSRFSGSSPAGFCSLGRLSHDVGWKYQDVIETLEAKRKVKAQDFYNRQVTKAKAVADAEKAVAAKAKPITAQIEAYGVRV